MILAFGGYSEKVVKQINEFTQNMVSDVDFSLYAQANYTKEQWDLLDLFQKTGQEAVRVQSQFLFSFKVKNPDMYQGIVVGCDRKEMYQVVLSLRLDCFIEDVEITYTCGIHEVFELMGDTAVIKCRGLYTIPPSEMKIYL